jgi:DNA-binding NarL/FixJ family response regulator
LAKPATGRKLSKNTGCIRPDITPDIALMDIQMPLMNGVETIIGIRGEFPNARIIVLSTYVGDVQVLRALKAGARAYIRKGHVHRELLDTIRAVMPGKSGCDLALPTYCLA